MDTRNIPVSVFVYGTLKPGGRYHKAYCSEFLLEAVPAIAPGLLYHLPDPRNYPAMTPGHGWVQGYVLRFSHAAVLERLDQLEDYHPQRPATENLYDRRRIELRLLRKFPKESPSQRHSLGTAWVYVMTEENVRRLGGVRVDSGNWQAVP